jgi:V8-like Glu-specific endopeptidase
MTKSQSLPRAAVKITGILTAMAVLFCLTAYFGSGYKVSADPPPPTSILRGDVDQNETVGILDLVLLNQFLVGQSNIDPDRADVNTDGVVDVDDATDLAGHIVKLTQNWWTEEVNVTSMTSANAGSRTYIKRNVSTGTTSTYTLNVNESPLPISNGIMPLGIVPYNSGEDDREAYTGSYENAIVELGRVNNGVFTPMSGTGFIIGNNKVVTAAHVMYERDSGAANPWIEHSGYYRNAIRVTDAEGDPHIYDITYVHIPQKYTFEADDNWGTSWPDYVDVNDDEDVAAAADMFATYFDYALLKIDTNINLDTTYGGINVGIATNDTLVNDTFSSSNNEMAVAGFPNITPNGSSTDINDDLYIGYGAFKGTLSRNFQDSVSWKIQYTADTTRGNSGSPVFYDKDRNKNTTSDLVAIGVHADPPTNERPYNKGSRFTPQHLKFFFNNPNF